MERWKSLSSGWVHQTFPGTEDFGWQVGFGSFSVSESNADRVIAYIDGQAEHHRRIAVDGTMKTNNNGKF